jgi:tetratricopeptide (TPR) repeat protein
MPDTNPQDTVDISPSEVRRNRLEVETPLQLDARAYELIEELGKGGMGEVHRCGDPALGRDLAIKVIKAEYRGLAEAERRFLREARITASLQHPGIVPIHNLGQLGDGRLHYTMRLVRGQTFAGVLKEEAGQPERLSYLLSVFEKICQAVAYAHSKRVIHRDLKPANVMVGKFGEVQVLDWGMAKLLTAGETAAEETTDATHIYTESPAAPGDQTRAGSALGTAAYMPPEQALGEWGAVDERADVFALGSILCQILTGRPAYRGRDGEEVFRCARRGDVSEAHQRLQQCGADEALIALCRECLSPQREERPRDASVLADRVRNYQAEVQERLRQAELERVAAQTRAQEEQARAAVERERAQEAVARVKAERRARRRAMALAGAWLVLLACGGGGVWWMQQVRAAAQARQDQADREARTALERAEQRLEEGWRTNDVPKLTEALAEGERAAAIARNGDVRAAVAQQVASFRKEAEERLDRARQNQQLLTALLDVAAPHETQTYRESESGKTAMALAEPSAEEQYAAAFRRRWPDVDVDKQAESEVAACLRQEPEIVAQGVIAGLDAWMLDRRMEKRSEVQWRRLLALVERLDTSEPRRQLRALLIGETPPSAASVVGLLAGPPPWPALWELTRGKNWRRLRQSHSRMNPADEPVLMVLLLAQASSAVGDLAAAEEVLHRALARWPDEVALLDALGKVLERQHRLTEAIGCYRAARAKRPQLGLALVRALVQAGQAAEGEAVSRDLVRQQPNNPEMFFSLGNALYAQKKHAAAEAAYGNALALQPEYAEAYYNLGLALLDRKKYAAAEAACREAIARKPDLAQAYSNLGAALYHQKKYVEAEETCRQAIALKADLAEAYNNLGLALGGQKKYAEAEAACRQAIALKPDHGEAYNTLGLVLNYQRKYAESEAACHKAIALRPDDAEAYCNLGAALYAQKKYVDTEAAYREAIALQPDYPEAHLNLGVALYYQEKYAESEAACRKAIALQPDLAPAYNTLGLALYYQKKHVDAETAYRKALALRLDYAEAYNHLGLVLYHQKKYAEAEAACRQAIALKPDHGEAYNALGLVLYYEKKYAEAEAACRKAIVLQPDYVLACYNLGRALSAQKKYAEAESSYRKAIALQPDFAEGHCNLGNVLRIQGRFAESLASYRRGHELGSRRPVWRYPSPQWVRDAERMVELEKKLRAILQGEAAPASADEAVSLAQMCQQPYKKLYAASARLYSNAFVFDPKLAADLNQEHRYNAACSSALAAASQGEDTAALPDKTAAMFRRWALSWLRDDLTAYAELAVLNNPASNEMIQQRMAHWRSDADLASVRDPQALDRLPDIERAAWHALWRDVDELANRTTK